VFGALQIDCVFRERLWRE